MKQKIITIFLMFILVEIGTLLVTAAPTNNYQKSLRPTDLPTLDSFNVYQKKKEGGSYYVQLTFLGNDPDGDMLTYYYSLNDGASWENAGGGAPGTSFTTDWILVGDHNGVYRIWGRAGDNEGMSNPRQVTITFSQSLPQMMSNNFFTFPLLQKLQLKIQSQENSWTYFLGKISIPIFLS